MGADEPVLPQLARIHAHDESESTLLRRPRNAQPRRRRRLTEWALFAPRPSWSGRSDTARTPWPAGLAGARHPSRTDAGLIDTPWTTGTCGPHEDELPLVVVVP